MEIVVIYICAGLAIAAVTSVPGVLVRRSTEKHEPMTALGIVVVTLFWPFLVVRWMLP